MSEQNGLICAYLLDGNGSGKELDWNGVKSWHPQDGPIWIHLERYHPENQRWLQEEANLERIICEALLAEETRPRCIVNKDALMVILRGVNMNPGADPEDMISIRMFIDQTRIITLRKPKLMAIEDIRDRLANGTGPKDTSDLLVQISDRLIYRMGPVVESIDEDVDDLEEQILESPSHEIRVKLSALRRKAISLRRYLAPQREVMTRLQMERIEWIDDRHRLHLREVADKLTRYIEDLDEARDRAAVTQEELAGKIADQMNKQMYILAIVATVFMPLGLLTGLLGINVGGIPGSDYHWGFLIVCVILVVLAIAEFWIFHRKKWF